MVARTLTSFILNLIRTKTLQLDLLVAFLEQVLKPLGLGLRTGRITGTAVKTTGHTGGIHPQTGRVLSEACPNGSGWVQNGRRRPSTAVFLHTH